LVINLKTVKALGIAAPPFARRRGDRMKRRAGSFIFHDYCM
jgi:hypothetical protein